MVGAGEWTRTTDLLITNQLLYQLSYASLRPAHEGEPALYQRQNRGQTTIFLRGKAAGTPAAENSGLSPVSPRIAGACG